MNLASRMSFADENSLPESPVILLVDDDPEILDATSILLETEGYVVRTAREGGEALEQIEGGLTPAIILLDLMMPGMNGFEFYGRLRGLPAPAGRTPVIVISAMRETERRAAELGAEDTLTKPYELSDLLDKIGRRLGRC